MLPDYQGIGVGTKFIEAIGRIVKSEGFKLNLTTTTPALVKALTKSKRWSLFRYGRVAGQNQEYTEGGMKRNFEKSSSKNRITYSFNYIPEERRSVNDV